MTQQNDPLRKSIEDDLGYINGMSPVEFAIMRGIQRLVADKDYGEHVERVIRTDHPTLVKYLASNTRTDRSST